jgi:hypothetical protein
MPHAGLAQAGPWLLQETGHIFSMNRPEQALHRNIDTSAAYAYACSVAAAAVHGFQSS